MPIKIEVKPSYIEYANEYCGSLNLMTHQKETRESSEELLILDAPTSSGKTLAMLARFVRQSKNAVFVYPTNELIKDQARGISESLGKIGKTSIVVPLEDGLVEESTDVDMVIAVVTGDSLEGLGKTKGEVLRRIFHLARGDNQLLLLTNIDTLLLLFKMRYWGGRTLLSEFLSLEQSLLAIDELHLYSGIEFANLFYLIWLLKDRFDQILVSSATLRDSLEVIKEIFKDYRIIRPKIHHKSEGRHCRKIKHETNLTIKPSSRRILSNADLDMLSKEVEELFDSTVRNNVDTLVIVNSVVFCEELADFLEGIYGKTLVGRINGIVPDKFRIQKPLTVGTKAVEVGVDFDVNNLIFEGTTSSSFIQRLGRSARHKPGKAVAFVPQEICRLFSKRFKEIRTERLTPAQLSSLVDETFPDLKSYAGFCKSVYGATLFASILYSVEKKASSGSSPMEMYKAIKEDFKGLVPPFFKKNDFKDLFKISGCSVLDIISQGGARGDILTVPVYLKRYQVYSRMDIFDLPQTIFYFEDCQNINAQIPPWMQEDRVAVIDGFGKRTWLKGDGHLFYIGSNRILYTKTKGEGKNFSLHSDTEELEKKMEGLLDKKIAHPTGTTKVTDWRFPRIYSNRSRGRCLVIGLDGLVQKYKEEYVD